MGKDVGWTSCSLGAASTMDLPVPRGTEPRVSIFHAKGGESTSNGDGALRLIAFQYTGASELTVRVKDYTVFSGVPELTHIPVKCDLSGILFAVRGRGGSNRIVT